MAKTAIIGIRALILHKLVGDVYSPGFQNEGVRNFTREVEQDITNLFADNVIYDTQEQIKTISGEITAYQFVTEMWEDFFGYQLESGGGYSDEADKNYGAITVIMNKKDVDTGKLGLRIGVLYKNKFNEPSLEQTTTEDAIEFTELVAPFTGVVSHVLGANGRNISYYWADLEPGVTIKQAIDFCLPQPVMPWDALPIAIEGEAPVIMSDINEVTWPDTYDSIKTYQDLVDETGVTAYDLKDGYINTFRITQPTSGTEYELTDVIDLPNPSTIPSIDIHFEAVDSDGNLSEILIITINVYDALPATSMILEKAKAKRAKKEKNGGK